MQNKGKEDLLHNLGSWSVVPEVGARLQSGDQPPLRRAVAFHFEEIGEQKGEIDRLLGIKPRIAECMIATVEIGLRDRPRAPGALRNILAGHLEMNAARVGTLSRMHSKEILYFLHDEIKGPGLEA
jgi:hypothetical protein